MGDTNPGETLDWRSQSVARSGRRGHTEIAYLELAPRPTSPSWARRHAQAALSAWDLPADIVETAILLVSELVTNACIASTDMLHGAGTTVSITQTLRHQPGRIVIEVSDPDPRPPVIIEADPDAESGRGLTLVQALSKEWAYFYPPTGGKTVYCTLTCDEPESQEQ